MSIRVFQRRWRAEDDVFSHASHGGAETHALVLVSLSFGCFGE